MTGKISKYSLYHSLQGVIPQRILQSLWEVALVRKIGTSFFQFNHKSTPTTRIYWEDLNFLFTASYEVLHKAQTRGIENRICRLARLTLDEGQVAIDVGANYGFISLVMAKSVGTTGQALSFEIEKKHCRGSKKER